MIYWSVVFVIIKAAIGSWAQQNLVDAAKDNDLFAIIRREKVVEKCPKCKKIIEEYPHTCKDKYLDDYEKDKGADAYDSGGDYGDGEDLS